MKVTDLVKDPAGHMSHTKLGNLIGMAVMTWVVVRHELAGNLSDDLLVWYGGILVAGAVVSKGVSMVGATK